MDIYVIGNARQTGEIEKKVSDKHSVIPVSSIEDINNDSEAVVFDFFFDDSPDDLDQYNKLPNINLFINATRSSLAELTYITGNLQFKLFGFAGDPTFLERPVLEVSAHHLGKDNIDNLLETLGINATLVADRVGLVTPRIIAMIIKEAYYTVMEGTASREDIDTGMKLGTNYPMGPFEWTEAWGLANIYELLEALYLDTKDERYKICPLLKQEYLQLD